MSVDRIVHVALLPSAGMGHLTPFLRLASILVHHNCHVTLITPQPTVSNAESKLLSKFLSSFPQVNHIKFNLPSSVLNNSASQNHDPFFLQFEAIRNSSDLLLPLLESLSPPLSSFVYDVLLTSPILPIAITLGIPHYILFTSSAAMFSFFSSFHTIAKSLNESDEVEIPGVSSISRSSIPTQLLDPKNILGSIFREDSPKLSKLHGVLVNTFEKLEAETLESLNCGRVVKELPPIYAIGPFVPCDFEKEGERGAPLKWLDEQPDGSVVYVSFGSRSVLGRDQIREIGKGLVRSGFRFLWVVKDNKVDKLEEEEEKIDRVLGNELIEKIKEKGLVVKEWVDQREILNHNAVRGFVSHCGWNSVIEAAYYGVPILGWSLHGDQKINAEVVVNGGWGVWNKNWGWQGECLVKGDEIGEAINDFMNNEYLVNKAIEVKNAAREAISVGGGSEFTIQSLIEDWTKSGMNISESLI